MKRLVVLCLALSAMTAAPARAQVFGQFTTAETLPMNGHLFGGYLNASENTLGLLAQLRLSFYPQVDFGFQGGVNRVDFDDADVTTLRLGADFKVQVLRVPDGAGVDFSVGGALGVETGDDVNVLSLGPTAVVSYPFPMGTNGSIAPYAGLGLLFGNLDVPGAEKADFSVPFRFGSEFRFTPEMRLAVELQMRFEDEFSDTVGIVSGVNLPF